MTTRKVGLPLAAGCTIVQDSVYEAFAAKLAAKVQAMPVGVGTEPVSLSAH